MSEEEIIEDLEEEEAIEDICTPHHESNLRLQNKNKSSINAFLGEGHRYTQAIIMPRYYGDLLAWSLWRHIEREGWKVVRILGYHLNEPSFTDVETSCGHKENLPNDGQLLVVRENVHIIITVDIHFRSRNSLSAEGMTRNKEEIKAFLESVTKIAKEENYYRGQKLEYDGRIHILDVKERVWDSIVLDGSTKREIRANTVEFLQKLEEWEEFGIPTRRGVLLAGEPGTGKTIICRALMGEARGITCISANAYALAADEYISDLYEMAQDLAPCLVFIEDIDLIGQDRVEFGYSRGPALLTLLSEMDGVEAHQQIVTIATTNCLDKLDKALRQRPSRFDCVVRLAGHNLTERQELVRNLCRKIPLVPDIQTYIARRATGFTPAQLQEIIFGLAIEHGRNLSKVTLEDVDHKFLRVKGNHGKSIGFVSPRNGEVEILVRTTSDNVVNGDDHQSE